MFPSPTTPPAAATVSRPSAVETCAFISGNPSLPLACHKGQKCAIDRTRSLLACCWNVRGGKCSVSTRCLDRGQSTLENFDGLDMLCSDERAPYCKTDIVTSDGELNGYSLFICDTDKVTDTILRHATTSSARLVETSASRAMTTGLPTSSDSGYYSRRKGGALNPSTISGIAIGSAGAFILLSIIIWVLWWRTPKKSKQHASLTQRPAKSSGGQTYELSAT